MNNTKIEWTDTTWNPITGCTPISPGCANCYARRMAKRMAGRCGYPAAPHEFDVTLHRERLMEPFELKKPRRIFVCSMSDLFHKDVPFEFIDKVFSVMMLAKKHTFQVLTKRVDRAVKYFSGARIWKIGMAFAEIAGCYPPDMNEWPLPNIWLGVTAENQEQADSRIPLLLQIPAAVRFVSVEPMLGPVMLGCDSPELGWVDYLRPPVVNGERMPGINWVICGGETGPGARPMDIAWARALQQQCAEAHVPFFYKGAGTAQLDKSDVNYRRLDGVLWQQFPDVAE